MTSAVRHVVLDAEGLSALATGDRRMQAWATAVERADADVHLSAVTLAETAGSGSREAKIHRALRALQVHEVDVAIGFAAARLRNAASRGRRKARDLTVDAVVAATATALGTRTAVLTSDRTDMERLLEGTGVRVEEL